MSTSDLSGFDESLGEDLVCRTCGLVYLPGTTLCARCGRCLTDDYETFPVDFELLAEEYMKRQQGKAFLPERDALSFIVDGEPLTVPPLKSAIIGRVNGDEETTPPDIDLTPFKAAQKGVSRYHASIKRNGPMLYLTDLQSRNGTWLNGKRLVGTEERLLRDGDTVRLGRLLALIRFR
jgi:FHA domain